MKNFSKFIKILSLMAMLPSFAFAQTSKCTGTGLGGLICRFHELLNAIVPVLIALGVVYFLWGVITYFMAGGEEAKKVGRDRIIYGIIGFAIIIGLWGLVNIVVTTFNLGASAPQLPKGTCSGITSSSKFQDLLSYVTCIIANSVIPFLFAAAAGIFIWGVLKYFVINADEMAKKAEGRQFMIWGVIALAVMISIWGLVNILGSTFGLTTNVLPSVRPPGSGDVRQ